MEAVAVEAGHPLEVAHPYSLGRVRRSCLDLSGYPEWTQQGHLIGQEGERERSGGGAAEARSWWDTRPGAEGTARSLGPARPSCLLSQSRK